MAVLGFSLVLILGCSLSIEEPPLPTLAPTAVAVSEQAVVSLIPTYTPFPTPTQAIPTASPTSPPTPTGPALSAADDWASLAAEEGAREFGTAVSQPSATVERDLPTAAPSTIPSATPTVQPTNTTPPTPVSFPRPPDVVWPEATPHGFPVSNSPRQGVAVAFGGAPPGSYGSGQYSWTYSWTTYVPPTPTGVEHIPMLVGSPRNGLPSLELVKERDAQTDHNYWLVFNECEHQLQCNTSPAEAARFFRDEIVDLMFTQGGDPDADLIIGGVNANPCGILWLKNFVDYYRQTYGPLPHAGWHFHLYPEIAPATWPGSCDGSWIYNDRLFPNVDEAFNLWREQANNTLAFVQEYGEPDDEIWFTEIGCLNYGGHQVQGAICQADGFMQDYAGRILGWLNGEGRWVTRYAWFTNWDAKYWAVTHLIADAPIGEQWQYSSLGYWYSHIEPAAAVPLPWP
ncbi:MAG: glycosyl hydrolase [Candidatus Promineifilaceae bacterium]